MGFGIQGYVSANNALYGSVVTTQYNLEALLDYAKSNLITSAQYGDWSSWIADVIYYPFPIGVFSDVYDRITINDVNTGVSGILLGSDKRAGIFSFNEPFVIFINATPKDILNTYNVGSSKWYSYIVTEIFLPYYGWCTVSNNIYRYDKVSCFLALEPRMGYGMYYICGHSDTLTHSSGRLTNNSQIQDINIIQAIPVQIGTHIPYGSDGQAQVNRNTLQATASYTSGLLSTVVSGVSGAVTGAVSAGPVGGVVGAVVGTVGGAIMSAANYTLDMGLAQQQNANVQGGLSGQFCTYTDIYPSIRITFPNIQVHDVTDLVDRSGYYVSYGEYTQRLIPFWRMYAQYATGNVYRANPVITMKYTRHTLLQADNVTFSYYETDRCILPEEYDIIRAMLKNGVWLPSISGN